MKSKIYIFMIYYLINNNFINIILDYIYVYEVLNWFFFYEREKLMFVVFFYIYLKILLI